jgi:hypothetical protein
MAYLLRALLCVITSAMIILFASAKGWIEVPFGHIKLSIPVFLVVMFTQTFVMFFFIGISRMVQNIHNILHGKTDLDQLFDNPPEDLTPYMKKITRFRYKADTFKRKIVPWVILSIVLGTFTFLMGGAYDTGAVSRNTHLGLSYGFIFTLTMGIISEWRYLKQAHILLRQVKSTFELEDHAM